MKKLLLMLTAFALFAALAVPAMAIEDETVTIDGITYKNLGEYFTSDYFKENGKRCGTVVADFESPGDNPLLPFDPSDCAVITRPLDEYIPATVIEIPVVVHNITASNGVTGLLTDATIISQIVVLNEDFRALPGTPGAPGYDSMVQFALATLDPDGNPTDGIDRVANDLYFADGGGYYNVLAWDPLHYMNLYTNNPGGGILGYVPWLPHSGPVGSAADRVVIWYRAFGDPGTYPPYNLGRTATHEVGHFLGLYHTFQGGCGSANCNFTGDTICDTEPEASQRFGCPTGIVSCSTPDPIHNYMDYTDDYCMNNFTFEQGLRMRCTLTWYRDELRNNMTAVGDVPFATESVRLHQNVPNPFNPKTEIRFEMTKSASAEMQIIDVSGRILREFDMGYLGSGVHTLTWDGRNYRGDKMSSGVYFYRLKVAGERPVMKQMTLLK